jgi:hypothetical protein
VRTPVVPATETARLNVQVAVGPDGRGRGGAGLALEGSAADSFLDHASTATPERLEASLRSIFGRLLPGVTLGTVAWTPRDGEVPSVSLSAAVELPQLIQGEGDRRSFVLPSFTATPEPRHLSGRQVPVVLDPGATGAEWKLNLPEGWCLPAAETVEAANALGRFRQSVEPAGRAVVLRRETELARRWAEPEDVPALSELALAEHRAARRRVRLACAEATAPATP